MRIAPESFKDWPVILQINYVISIIFLILGVLLLFAVIFMRLRKNKMDRRKKHLENLLIDFINNFLFDEDFNKSRGLVHFKSTHLKTGFDSKIASKQLLLFNENLKGESSALISELFYGLGLYKILLKDLTNGGWHEKTRALYIFNKLSIKIPEVLVEQQLNTKRHESRHQAMMYLINQSDNNPLSFFDKIESPFSLLHQVGVENALKSYEGEIPDFSKWLTHKQCSIVIFCIKMIVDHNQFENILYVQQLVNHPNDEVRKQAIISLRKMEIADVLPLLIKNFSQEGLEVKRQILKFISKLGSEADLKAIAPHIQAQERMLKIDYLKIARTFSPKISRNKSADLKEFDNKRVSVNYS